MILKHMFPPEVNAEEKASTALVPASDVPLIQISAPTVSRTNSLLKSFIIEC